MSNKQQNPDKVERIRTGFLERRLSIAKAGMMAGTRLLGNNAANLLRSPSTRRQRNSEALSREAKYLVKELGKLKGSIVKVGQMLALYGEHFLPPEVTEALHSLEDQTTELEWHVVAEALQKELGKQRMAELEIDPKPLGAASLGQVHRARTRDGLELCLKVQYPGVASAIDNDLNALTRLLLVGRIVSAGRAFNEWLEEVRFMLHQEVDYKLELHTTARFADYLAYDDRFRIPEVFPEFSTGKVLATSYEAGEPLSDQALSQLPQWRRDRLGSAVLDLLLMELFHWGELQTDPNLGNYRLRLDEKGQDALVLLDFGAVRRYPDRIINACYDVIKGCVDADSSRVISAAKQLQFLPPKASSKLQQEFFELCTMVMEPFGCSLFDVPTEALDHNGNYHWGEAHLIRRVASLGAHTAWSKHFQLPPKEFLFLTRKLAGVYSLLAKMNAEFDPKPILQRHLDLVEQCTM